MIFANKHFLTFKIQIKQQESEKDVLLASNKSLAEYNLKFEPKINSNKAKLIELYQSASELDSVVQEKEKVEKCNQRANQHRGCR